MRFNSILVQLEAQRAHRRQWLVLYGFNSILVQLEASLVTGKFRSSAAFQFHIGAIRSAMAASDEIKATTFQFHIGAIRSGHHKKSCNACDTRFNSILVQLEVYFWKRERCCCYLVSIPYWCN